MRRLVHFYLLYVYYVYIYKVFFLILLKNKIFNVGILYLIYICVCTNNLCIQCVCVCVHNTEKNIYNMHKYIRKIFQMK